MKDNIVQFNGFQVCKILGYINPKNMIKQLVYKKHIKYLKDIFDNYKLYPNVQTKLVYLS